MAAFLTINRPRVSQWYHRRNRPLTGCTVIHTAENVADFVGPDTAAEAVAKFIQGRDTPGSYHDLTDFDSGIQLVEYIHGAYHDATGSNNWALSLSFACRTTDWAKMSPERRRGFLWQGAFKFVQQQLWRAANNAPLTRVRLITKAQSDAGESGLTFHGYRDPNRRTDPGTKAPNLFPFEEFADACRQALADFMPSHPDALKRGPQVTGAIREAYNRIVINQARWSFFIGAPLGNAAVTWAGDAYWQQFERGAIYAHQGVAAVVWGDILKKFWAIGAEKAIGYPKTDERATPNGAKGRYNHFERGSIYWSPATGAQTVWGLFRDTWAKEGWEQSFLGFPTTGEYKAGEDGQTVMQNFEGGRLELRKGQVVIIRGA